VEARPFSSAALVSQPDRLPFSLTDQPTDSDRLRMPLQGSSQRVEVFFFRHAVIIEERYPLSPRGLDPHVTLPCQTSICIFDHNLAKPVIVEGHQRSCKFSCR